MLGIISPSPIEKLFRNFVQITASFEFPLPQNPAFTAHFKLFSMVSAGRDSGSFSFETNALREHIGVYLTFVSALRKLDFDFPEIVVELSDTRVVSQLCSVFGMDRGNYPIVCESA